MPMTVRELGNECNEYSNCDDCPYHEECRKVENLLDGINPYELLAVLDKELEERRNHGNKMYSVEERTSRHGGIQESGTAAH